MKVEIDIPDNEIREAVKEIIAKQLVSNYSNMRGDMNRYGIPLAVKDCVYEHKDELIEKCIERASVELTKKALPKLLNKLSKGD